MRGVAPALVAGILVVVLGATAATAARAPKKLPKPEAVPGELIVRFRDGVGEEERGKALAAADARAERNLAKGKPLKLAKLSPEKLQQALKKLRSDPRVVYAEPNYRLHALGIPNDPSLGQLWGLVNNGQSVNGIGGTADADIDADAAWNVSTGSSSVVVGVIDTGVDFAHPDLAGAQWTNPGETGSGRESNGVDDDGNGYVDDWRGWDFASNDNNPVDDHGHGTHVAGTIGARGNDGAGIVGVGWQTSIAALKFLDEFGGGTTAGAIEAIEYATAAGIPITNNSWGGGERSLALRDAIAAADAAGSLFVAAAGNDGTDNDAAPSYPASYDLPNVISVAASDQRDALPAWSNRGRSSVDLAAPGANVYSSVPGGYDWWDGTSMATPHVAGTAALAKAAFPGATAVGLKALLLRTVDPAAAFASTTATGGRLNAGRALSCAGAPQLWLDSPGAGFDVSVGEPVPVRVLAASCGAATAAVTVTVNGTPLALDARGDGLYTATYTPSAPGSLTVEAAASSGGAVDSHTVSGVAQQNYHYTEVAHEWLDATLGARIAEGDETITSVALPFAFSYWGAPRSSVRVSSNGFLAFGASPFAAYDTKAIPDAGEPNGIVAPYWDDLVVPNGGGVWARTVGTAPNRRFVVSWNDAVHYGYAYGAISFQAVLEEGTNAIVFNYRDTVFGDPYWDNGNLATIGVESVDGLVGRQFSHRTPSLSGYAGTRSLRWGFGAAGGDGTPPPPPPADTTPPAAPAGLTAVADNARVSLDWADNAEGDLAGYRVHRSADGGATWAVIASGSASAWVDSTVANGTSYAYRVTARDSAGNESAPSAVVTATPRARLTAVYRAASYNVVQGSLYAGTLASLNADDGDRLEVRSVKQTGWHYATFAASATMTSTERSTLAKLTVDYDGNATTTGAWVDVLVYNVAGQYWEYVAGDYASTGDRVASWSTTTPRDYVSATGVMRVRVAGDAPGAFRTRTDLVRFTIEY